MPVWNDPTQASWDSQNGYLYVTNFGSVALGGNTASVIDAATDTSKATIPVGDDPIASVYDPADGYDYILNYGFTLNLSVLHGTSVVGSVPVGTSPFDGLYDPSNGDIYVTNAGSGNVSIVNGTSVVATIRVGSDPGVMSYDPVRHLVFVPNTGTANVSVINGTHLVATLGAGIQPVSTVYDPANGWTYVLNSLSNNVTIYNGTAAVGSVAAGGTPSRGGYDPIDQDVYVTDAGSNSVVVFRNTTIVANLSVGVDPRNVVYDSADQCLYIPQWGSNNVYVINGTTVVAVVGVGANPYSAIYDPGNQGVYSVDFNSANLTHLGTPDPAYPVLISETGLPSGTPWTVDLGNGSYPVRGVSVTVPEANATYSFFVPRVPGWAPNTTAVNVTVLGSPVSVTVPFVPTYPITFHETGLATGVGWNVSIAPYANDSTGANALLDEPNGTYTYVIGPVLGYLGPTGGSVQVDGSAVEVNLTFTALLYPVRFVESGLTPGTNWTVTIGILQNSSTSNTISFEEPNGSYAFAVPAVAGYSQSPATGPVFVNGTPNTIPITFTRLYAVNFTVTGLPGGSDWAVRIAGANRSTNASWLTLGLVNGTYPYAFSTLASGYAPVVPTGNLVIHGAPVDFPVVFAPTVPPPTYWLYFHATGLPLGAAWIVHLGNASNSSVNANIGFPVVNGTYAYSVTANGYNASPERGNVTVDGPSSVAMPVAIAFTAIVRTVLYDLLFLETGLPPGTVWNVTIGGQTAGSGGSDSVVLREPNGTYGYTLGAVPGYRARNSGPITVAGQGPTVPLRFTATLFPVTFQESGLAPGSPWNVTAGSISNSSTGNVVVLWLPNGTYTYAVSPVSGYEAMASGTVVVAGAPPAVIQLIFAPTAPGTSTMFGLPSAEGIGLVVVIVAIVAIGLALLLWRRRRPPGADETYVALSDDGVSPDPGRTDSELDEAPAEFDR